MNVLMMIVMCVLGAVLIWHDKAIKAFKKNYHSNLGRLQRQIADIEGRIVLVNDVQDEKCRELVAMIQAICPHTGKVMFTPNWTDGMGTMLGRKICLICGKELKRYSNESEYDKDKAEYESKIRYEGLNQKKAEIDAELATLKKRDKKGKFTK